MMNEWKKCNLSDVIVFFGGGTPKTSVPEYWNGEIPWLSVVDFNTGNKYVEKTITKVGLKNCSTKILETGDIIISVQDTVFGSIGKSDFENIDVILPPQPIIQDFEANAKTINDKLIENCKQIMLLEKLRKYLLPKLMIGDAIVEV